MAKFIFSYPLIQQQFNVGGRELQTEVDLASFAVGQTAKGSLMCSRQCDDGIA